MRLLLIGFLLAAFLAAALWVRMGRPGAERLPRGLRPLARRLPALLLPLLGAAMLWSWLRPAPVKGLRRRH